MKLYYMTHETFTADVTGTGETSHSHSEGPDTANSGTRHSTSSQLTLFLTALLLCAQMTSQGDYS